MMTNLFSLAAWDRASPTERLEAVIEKYKKYCIAVSAGLKNIHDFRSLVKDQESLRREFVLTLGREKKVENHYYLFAAPMELNCNIDYRFSKDKFHKQPDPSLWIMQKSPGQDYILREDYAHKLEAIVPTPRRILVVPSFSSK